MNNDQINETLKQFSENMKNGKDFVANALGDMAGCSTYPEKEIREGIWRTKFLGISFWYQGIYDNDIIDRATITKRAFMEGIRLIERNRYLIPLILLFNGRFIKSVIVSILDIYRAEGGLKSRCLKLENFCLACQELIRAGLKFAEEDLVYCFAMFLQFSPAYRFRVQDFFGEINKEEFNKSPIEELWRVKKIVISREKTIKGKWDVLFAILTLAMIIPKYRKLVCNFINELDLDQLGLNDSDWYYCLRRKGYDFGGKSLEDRLKEAEIIDKEESNILFGI